MKLIVADNHLTTQKYFRDNDREVLSEILRVREEVRKINSFYDRIKMS